MRLSTKSGFPVALAFTVAALGAITRSHASDHIDGVKTGLDNAADLTDLYAFTSPTDPNKVVLALGAHSIAYSGTSFSNQVDYQFRIRPIQDGETLTPSSDSGKERTIVCRFAGGTTLKPNQRATCTLDLIGGSETISFDTRTAAFKAGGVGESGSTRVFAGVRSDPWFLDLKKTLKFNAGLPVAKGAGINGLWGQNILAIVVEVDKQKLPGPLFAVTAQTVRR